MTGQIVTDIDPEQARVVRWKIDLFLIPTLSVCYMLQFLDKQTLSYSSLLSLLQDTHLVGNQFSWTVSIFYFGILFWSYPTAYFFVRFPIGKYLAVTTILWSAALMSHAACQNFTGLMVTRFILGACEASIIPGFSLLTGMWYTRDEQPIRYGSWFSGDAIGTTFGGLIAYGIGHIKHTLSPWRWMFLIFGAVTCLWGVLMLVLLPDHPSTAFWLTKAEREIAVHRILNAQHSTPAPHARKFQLYQVREAFIDPMTWFLSLSVFCACIATGGIGSFGSLVIRGFGYEGLSALLIQMPSGGAPIVFILLGTTLCSVVRDIRTIVMFGLALTGVLGIVLIYALDSANRAGHLAGFCLCMATSAYAPLAMSLVTANVGGATKRVTVHACVLVLFCVGNIVGPQFFSPEEAPRYERGIRASLSGLCLGAF